MNSFKAFGFLCFVLLAVVQSCVMFTFVGGHAPLATFSIEANYDQVASIVDEFSKKNNGSVLRLYDGSGYDIRRYRRYKLSDSNLIFDIKFLDETTGWKYRANYSEIALTFMRVNEIPINSNSARRLTRLEKELCKKGLVEITERFIEPIKSRVR